LVGSAQKIFEKAILQHGSIIFDKKHEEIVSFLKVAEQEKNNQRNYLKAHAVSLKEISTLDISPCMLAEKLIDEISISQKIHNIFYRYTDSDELKLAESFYDKVIINK
jgi:lipoate-protein ligase A